MGLEPNDAENSYLIHKLDGRAEIVGDRMPKHTNFLSEADHGHSAPPPRSRGEG